MSPDFSDFGADDEDDSNVDRATHEKTGQKQMHIKGEYGTDTVVNTDGCRVCGRNADRALLVGVSKYGTGMLWDEIILSCKHHEGDIRGDLEYPREEVTVKKFDEED